MKLLVVITAAIVVLMATAPKAASQIWMYYSREVWQCETAEADYQMYAEEFDPLDFQWLNDFFITAVTCSSSIPAGTVVPLVVADDYMVAQPSEPGFYQQEVTFTGSPWELFVLNEPQHWEGDFWIRLEYLHTGVPFPSSDSESIKRNMVNRVGENGGWEGLFCDMAIGVFVEPPTGIGEGHWKMPMAFELSQNFPNPFNPSTSVSYELPERSKVSLQIFDLRGRLVNTLVDDVREAGQYSVQWNGTNLQGEKVSSGIYLYRLDAGGEQATRKMVVAK